MPERKLVTEALKRGIGAVTVEDVTREMRERPLIRSDVDGRKMATLERLLKAKSGLAGFVNEGMAAGQLHVGRSPAFNGLVDKRGKGTAMKVVVPDFVIGGHTILR